MTPDPKPQGTIRPQTPMEQLANRALREGTERLLAARDELAREQAEALEVMGVVAESAKATTEAIDDIRAWGGDVVIRHVHVDQRAGRSSVQIQSGGSISIRADGGSVAAVHIEGPVSIGKRQEVGVDGGQRSNGRPPPAPIKWDDPGTDDVAPSPDWYVIRRRVGCGLLLAVAATFIVLGSVWAGLLLIVGALGMYAAGARPRAKRAPKPEVTVADTPPPAAPPYEINLDMFTSPSSEAERASYDRPVLSAQPAPFEAITECLRCTRPGLHWLHAEDGHAVRTCRLCGHEWRQS